MVRRTSAIALEEIKKNGMLSRGALKIYEWLYHNGPATAGEVAKGIDYGRNNTSTRLSMLRQAGCTEGVGERKCQVTGFTVIVWDVTDQLPRKIKKGPPGKSKGQLQAERDWLFGECLRLKALLKKNGIEDV